RPRPPRSTPFPYTTLFRSGDGEGDAAVVRDLEVAAAAVGVLLADLARVLGRALDAVVQARQVLAPLLRQRVRGDVVRELRGHRLDRKSTRLNSSHVSISYA